MNNIKEARIKTGMKRTEVAKLLQMPYRTLENWEKGVNYPAPYIERLIIKELAEYTPNETAETRNIVTNEYGVDIDFELAVNYMDDEIREKLHLDMAPCEKQDFFDAYCKAHYDKFGEEFEFAKENPVY